MATGGGEQQNGANSGKERAIRALIGRGFRQIGVDGSGLPLFKSGSGALLIAIGSCRCLAYSRAGPGGRLQLVATARTRSLLCRISSETVGLSDELSSQREASDGAPVLPDPHLAWRQVDASARARAAA
jgi:hypothetical protein